MSSKKILINILLILFFSLYFIIPINLTNSDLGRHLKNGELFIKYGKIIDTNFYSYTEPNFPVVTHHWLSGVIFYCIYSHFGFSGLTIFYSVVGGTFIFLLFKLVSKYTNFYIALCTILVTLPLLSFRREIRPELFSYILILIFLLIYEMLRLSEISWSKALIFLLPLQILWINMHIFFIIGILISVVFTLNELIKIFLKRKNKFLLFSLITMLLIFSCLINPFTYKGLMEPLIIFRNYAYPVAENISLVKAQKLHNFPEYLYTDFLMILFVILIARSIIQKKFLNQLPLFTLGIVFLIQSLLFVRSIPIFAIFFTPILASSLKENFLINNFNFKKITIILLVISILLIFLQDSIFYLLNGIGLERNNNGSADFFKSNNLKGPIFNNYGIGGFLIYNFYGKEPVFVDNRPEAYPSQFFTDVYLPALEDENKWRSILEKYNFNIIYFYKNPYLSKGAAFLQRRMQDNDWACIFKDDNVIVFIRNSPENLITVDRLRINDSSIF